MPPAHARDFVAYDYAYTTGGGQTRMRRHTHVLAIRAPTTVPPVLLRREGIADRLTAMFGEDIQLRDEAFDRRFWLTAPTPRSPPHSMSRGRGSRSRRSTPRSSSSTRAGSCGPPTGATWDAAEVPGILDGVPEVLDAMPRLTA